MHFVVEGGEEVAVAVCVLDCDGVIFDSNSLKTDAYRRCLAALGVSEAGVQDFVKMHVADASLPRDVKFERFFTEMYSVANPKEMVAKAIQGYSQACDELYQGLTPVAEALAFVRACPKAHVVSGTAEDQLQQVFKNHNLDALFRSVRGSPKRKVPHLREIIASEGVDPLNVLFVGDGRTDFKTAQECGVHFCFLEAMTDWRDHSEVMAGAARVTRCKTWGDILARTKQS